MASMAATLAASLPAPVLAQKPKESSSTQSAKVPQRMEGVLDVEATREVESVNLNSLVCSPANVSYRRRNADCIRRHY